MPDRTRPSLYTIGLDHVFSDALVEGILARFDSGGLSLARGLMILPNHRAQLAVRDAFVRQRGEATLLPRMVVIGDGDLDGATAAALDPAEDAVAPAIDPMARLMLLAGRIIERDRDTSVAEALRDATSLAQVIDQLLFEGHSLDAFAKAIAEDAGPLAAHWHKASALALEVLAAWPQMLAERGLIERADQRNILLDRTTQRWTTHGLPAPWAVAAGITTSAPAVARLLGAVARAPGGAVVLPHLDRAMAVEEWDALGGDPMKHRDAKQCDDLDRPRADEAHPMYHLKLLLDRMDCHRDEAEDWVAAPKSAAKSSRAVFTRHMMAAAQFTDDWPNLPPSVRRLDGVTLCDCATPAEEALTIALAMREMLEAPGKTAALITPDRSIAARVAAQLARWGITADDSAGTPLANTSSGSLFLLIAECIASRFAPNDVLALLNHPLGAVGGDRLAWLDGVRGLDRALRGPRPAAGLTGIAKRVGESKDENLKAWWADVTPLLEPLDAYGALDAGAPLSDMLTLLDASFALLAGDQAWTGQDGRDLSGWLSGVADQAAQLPHAILPGELPGIIGNLMAGVTVRSAYRGHPRLFIWGLIEARLQRAGRVILAGLNEGQWPVRAQPDPWLAPVLRKRLGLPQAERQAGLAAHDFISALGADEVIVTRALRDGSAPTVASRLRLRIDALLGERGVAAASKARWRDWAQALDRDRDDAPYPRPQLMPPAARRPRRLSVTEVDTLLVDPFAFYARNALGLRLWDRIDADPTMAWRGVAVHDVLEKWLKGGEWSVAAVEGYLDTLLRDPGLNPIIRTIWAPRLRLALGNFVGLIHAAQAGGRKPMVGASEKYGAAELDGIALTGRPDRIDLMPDGTLAIVDYKTGSNPDMAMVDAGFALQLGLLGWMAGEGAFGKPGKPASVFEYWRTNRNKSGELGWIDVPFRKKDPQITPENFVEVAQSTLRELIARYFHGDAPFIAKKIPEYAIYGDYDQLMRLEEWYGTLSDTVAPDTTATATEDPAP